MSTPPTRNVSSVTSRTTRWGRWTLLALGAGCLALALARVGGTAPPAGAGPVAERVAIAGYDGDVMEPFLSRDGRLLFFNDRNAPGMDTDLHLARAAADGSFVYGGRLPGANSAVLDGVASLDPSGRFFFVSPRSYGQTACTLFSGRFAEGRVSGVTEVAGTYSRRAIPWVTMDAEIAADGRTLYYADTRFDLARSRPEESDLRIARRTASGSFDHAPADEALLAAVNTPALEYAPATSADQRALYFTRLTGGFEHPVTTLMVSRRDQIDRPFGPPRALRGVAGFVEAPTVTPDGKALYFHRRDPEGFRLYRVRVEPHS